MQYFLIKYRFKEGSKKDWHQEIARFTAAIDSDPVLKGKLSYRCLKAKEGEEYYHLACAVDDQTVAALQEKSFFNHYTEKTEQVSGGELEVVPLELVGETKSVNS